MGTFQALPGRAHNFLLTFISYRMNIGYARTFTIDQIAGLEAQLKELKAVGCEKIFREQVSSYIPKFLGSTTPASW